MSLLQFTDRVCSVEIKLYLVNEGRENLYLYELFPIVFKYINSNNQLPKRMHILLHSVY